MDRLREIAAASDRRRSGIACLDGAAPEGLKTREMMAANTAAGNAPTVCWTSPHGDRLGAHGLYRVLRTSTAPP